ncbi:acetyltransferase [Pseudomonas brassicacearum]|uniref:Acetyltransferase n=1 Tax=Pseudomonas brassicacearum TaxID=930166 RepID=A0A423H3F2_9PSED|nr:acetyltransferase [Pseudomonas brassicacearum]RON06748.1 acetyltransferase [Pseudomonas brassicacearum]
MKRLAILGAGGHGKVVADTAECCGWECVDFFADGWPGQTTNGSWSVVGDTSLLIEQLSNYDGVVVAIGHNSIRKAKLDELARMGAPLVSLVHPAATVSRRATVGLGSVVFAGVVVNVDAVIGQGAILNTGCSVDHDCVLGECVHVSPGARLAGGVQVGNLSWIGIGASVRQLIRIGAGVTVGAGAVAVSDVEDSVTVLGVPAKVIFRT